MPVKMAAVSGTLSSNSSSTSGYTHYIFAPAVQQFNSFLDPRVDTVHTACLMSHSADFVAQGGDPTGTGEGKRHMEWEPYHLSSLVCKKLIPK